MINRTSTLSLVLAASLISSASSAAEGEGVWVQGPNGWSNHLQSGFGCPPALIATYNGQARTNHATLPLRTVIVGTERQPAGEQVGCEYEDANGSWASVELMRLAPGETASSRFEAMRKRILARFSNARPDPDAMGWKPTSPTGGRTYAAAYRTVNADQRATIAAVGGDVAGWAITLIQHDRRDSTSVQLGALSNWQTVANSRGRR